MSRPTLRAYYPTRTLHSLTHTYSSRKHLAHGVPDTREALGHENRRQLAPLVVSAGGRLVSTHPTSHGEEQAQKQPPQEQKAPETPAESRRERPDALAKRRVGTGWTTSNRVKSTTTPSGSAATALLPLHLRTDGSLAPPTPPLPAAATPDAQPATAAARIITQPDASSMLTPVAAPPPRFASTPETRGEGVVVGAAAGGSATPALAQYWYEAGVAHSTQVQEEAPATQFVTNRRRVRLPPHPPSLSPAPSRSTHSPRLCTRLYSSARPVAPRAQAAE
jgi:hypothetical protein